MRCANRRYLFLQGPHGPFFAELAAQIRADGGQVWRAGVNAGDEAEWAELGYIAVTSAPPQRDQDIAQIMSSLQITDLVLYGDQRSVHQRALDHAKQANVRCHIFEEGYLRPSWVTYERDGTNQRSPAATWPLGRLQSQLKCDRPQPAAKWGALWPHVRFGLRYHTQMARGAKRYPKFERHRDKPLTKEAWHALVAALTLPATILWRSWSQSRLLRRNQPFITVLLQLEHDSALQSAKPLASHDALLHRIFAAFSKHSTPEQNLVVKMHPLETRRLYVARLVSRLAHQYGIADRVRCLPGGRLAPVLDRTSAAITVNSTAGQQVLWRGRPLFAFGSSVYAHKELLPVNDLNTFFTAPQAPDPDLYARFRAFLFRTSQIEGSFYSAAGRAQAIRNVVPLMVQSADPYDQEAAVAPSLPHSGLIPSQASGQVAVTR